MQIVINGLLVTYNIFGKENIDTIVILHGWGRGADDWKMVSEELAATYKVITLDLPGFGSSTQPDDSFDTYKYADFIQLFLEKLKIDEYTIIGHSLGGRFGIVIASESKSLKELILVDSAGVEKRPAKVKVIKALKPVLTILPKSYKMRVKHKLRSDDYNKSGSMKAIFIKIIEQDLSHLLPMIKDIPTTIIWGDMDKVLPIENAKELKESIPNSHIRIVWGAGHHPHLDKPEEFMVTLNEVLDAK